MMKSIVTSLAKRCDEAETYRLVYESTTVGYSNNRLKSCETKQSAGTALRVIKDGRIGTAVASGDGTEEPLKDMAVEAAKWGPEATFGFASKAEYDVPDLERAEETACTIDEMVAVGATVIDGLREAWPELVCGASVSKSRFDVAIEATTGMAGSFGGTDFGVGASVQASKEGDIFQWTAQHSGVPTEESMAEFFEYCHRWISLGLQVADIEPGAYPVILAPNSLPWLLRTLEAGIKGNNIHEKKSPLTNKVGERVLSEDLTIVDDPTWGRTGKTVPFDDEGTVTRPWTVFDKGVFTGPMVDLEYAAKLGIAPTGNGFREQHIYRNRVLSAGVAISPSNWRLAGRPGATSEELIASVDEGVYVDCSFDCWMGTIINGDFTGTLHRAYKIEKGQLVGRLKHRSISGNIYDVLGSNLQGVSVDVEQPRMGFDTIEAPHLLVSNVSIS